MPFYKLNRVITIFSYIRLTFQMKISSTKSNKYRATKQNQVSFSKAAFLRSDKTVLSQHEGSQLLGNIPIFKILLMNYSAKNITPVFS